MCQAVIVVPCYNERERLDAEALRRFSEEHPDVFFLLVDDGSIDGTGSWLEQLAAELPRTVRALRLPANGGKAEAVRAGMREAGRSGAPLLGYWDADWATPLEEIPNFMALFREKPELEVVTGCRLQRLGAEIQRSPVRHLIGRVMATIFSLYLKLPVYDTQCGAKLFRRETAERLFAAPFVSRWLFDVELFRRMPRDRAQRVMYEYPLSVWRDVGGSKLKMRHGFRIFLELWRVLRHYR